MLGVVPAPLALRSLTKGREGQAFLIFLFWPWVFLLFSDPPATSGHCSFSSAPHSSKVTNFQVSVVGRDLGWGRKSWEGRRSTPFLLPANFIRVSLSLLMHVCGLDREARSEMEPGCRVPRSLALCSQSVQRGTVPQPRAVKKGILSATCTSCAEGGLQHFSEVPFFFHTLQLLQVSRNIQPTQCLLDAV